VLWMTRSRRSFRLTAVTAGTVAALLAVLLAPATAQATFPGKNGKIAFSFLAGPTNFGSDDFEIYTIVPGEDPVALRHQNPRKDNWPDWSPDGSKIVWWHQAPAGNIDVWVMNADGSGQTNLTTENTGADVNAAWSPDGTEIVLDSNYNTDTGFSEIQVMSAGGTFLRQLTHNGPEFDNFGQFSPDGTRIAWTHDPTGEDPAIYTMDSIDGSNIEKITPDWLKAGLPDWSPDGKRILFVDNFCGPCPASDIWVINVDGGNLTRLTNTPSEHEFRPGWSPDGRKITFTSVPLTEEHPDADLPADIYVMHANGRGRTNITNTPTYNERASDWGPRRQGDEDN
jgi:Tol biopolymer transport system component